MRFTTSTLTTTAGAAPSHPRAVERGTPKSVAMVRSPLRWTNSGADGHSGGDSYGVCGVVVNGGVGRRDDNSRKNVRNVRKDSSASDSGSPEAPTVYREAVRPACAANCAVIVTAHDTSGDTGQNCDRGILAGNCEFWPVSSELDGIRFGLANRRLRPLGHLTADVSIRRSALA